MDKVALIIKGSTSSILKMSHETLDSECNITIGQEDLEHNNVLAFIDSCEFQLGILNACDDNISDLTIKVLSRLPQITIKHSGVQGEKLLKLLTAIQPEKEGQFRRALMIKQDMLEVLG